MKHRFFLLVTAVGVTMAATSFLLFLFGSTQLTQAELPRAEITPTSIPTPRPPARPIEIWHPTGPRNLINPPPEFPTPVIRVLIDLNVDTDRYDELGVRQEQQAAILELRCDPPAPPEAPYPGTLDGCLEGGAGITYLNEIVDAGIMTRQEVNDTFAGLVVQEWR